MYNEAQLEIQSLVIDWGLYLQQIASVWFPKMNYIGFKYHLQ